GRSPVGVRRRRYRTPATSIASRSPPSSTASPARRDRSRADARRPFDLILPAAGDPGAVAAAGERAGRGAGDPGPLERDRRAAERRHAVPAVLRERAFGHPDIRLVPGEEPGLFAPFHAGPRDRDLVRLLDVDTVFGAA